MNLPQPDAVCDGGDLDCGSGLLPIIRNAMMPLAAGGVLEVRGREVSVREDLPAWWRMVGHGLLGVHDGEDVLLSGSYGERRDRLREAASARRCSGAAAGGDAAVRLCLRVNVQIVGATTQGRGGRAARRRPGRAWIGCGPAILLDRDRAWNDTSMRGSDAPRRVHLDHTGRPQR